MLLSNRCLLARVQPRPARPSKVPSCRGKKENIYGPSRKDSFYIVLLINMLGFLRNGRDKRTPQRNSVLRDECRQRNYSNKQKHSVNNLRNKGIFFFLHILKVQITNLAAFRGQNAVGIVSILRLKDV